jgi:class 3 adenylate cyclase/tetratricopeptide (TPR) repeat protein
MVCPECGTANPDEARFCLNCGVRLGSSVGRQARLASYLPSGMLAKLEAARAGRSMAGERRIVTMLFCDVVGSTAMAETLDPEEWTEIMNGAFENLIAPVYRYEGTLARLMGDAIFAFFGAPIAHEDDPQRAVAAGLEIVERIGAYREQVKADRDLELNVRVGINTGPVVVGEVGSDLRLEYTAMGDAVNVAARMEQTAEPGTVQIAAETHRLVAPLFDVESRGAIEVKGKAEPVEAYRVVGRKERPGRVRGSRAAGAPLVAREPEMATLRRAVEEAFDGRGQIVCLIGEAGLGKSRLIEETQEVWAERQPDDTRSSRDVPRIWEVWQCVSYDTTRPYAQYRRMLAGIAGISDTDPPDVVRAKLVRTIDFAEEWVEPHMRVWRSLFGVQEPGDDALEGEAFKRAITELVPGSTRHAGAEPRLLVFEDLHWCDDASMDLLIETAKLVDDLPCLFVFAFRPDRHAPSWRLKQWLETEYPHQSTEIVLSPLTHEESGALIDALLPETDRPDAVRDQLLQRAEGNPLFVEEMSAEVLAQTSNELAIPATLQALITARLDRLDEDTRRTLQLASVIGRSFLEPVLDAVAGDGADLRTRLSTLERVGLIAETARTPEREYAFHHSLTQEATYGTILRRERRELHLRVGEALERLYANRIEEFAPLLARHFVEAGDDERTLRYATVAGDHAAKLYANAEAVTHFASAIEAERRLGKSDTALHHLYPSRGRALELAGRFDEAVGDYEEMRALAEEIGDRAAVLEADMALATLYSTPNPRFDAARGRAVSEQTVSLARELGDRAAESKALWNLMNLNVFGGGDLREAVEVGERSLALAREVNARQQMAFTLNDLWRPYAAIGDLRRSRASLEEAETLWRELGILPMLTENRASLASLFRMAGDDRQALALAEEAVRIAEEIGNLWGQSYGLLNVYGIYRDRGDVGKAMATMESSIAIAERGGFIPPLGTTRADLASVLAYLGAFDRAHAVLRIALQVAEERPITLPRVMGAKAELHLLAGELDEAEAAVGDTEFERLPEPLRSTESFHMALVRGRIAVARGEHAQAVEIAETVLERLRSWEIRPFVAEALLLKGRSLAASGNADDAERVLAEARTHAERLEHRLVLWEVLRELSQIAAARGDAEQAAGLRSEARGIVERIADGLDDEGLRSSFLARPDVRVVLSGE